MYNKPQRGSTGISATLNTACLLFNDFLVQLQLLLPVHSVSGVADSKGHHLSWAGRLCSGCSGLRHGQVPRLLMQIQNPLEEISYHVYGLFSYMLNKDGQSK